MEFGDRELVVGAGQAAPCSVTVPRRSSTVPAVRELEILSIYSRAGELARMHVARPD